MSLIKYRAGFEKIFENEFLYYINLILALQIAEFRPGNVIFFEILDKFLHNLFMILRKNIFQVTNSISNPPTISNYFQLKLYF